MTYMFILKCALKLVLKNILYYDARSEKHQIKVPREVDARVPPCPIQNHPVNSIFSTGVFTLEIVRAGLSAEGGFFTELIF